jgi:hypothetical protein
VMHMFAIEFFLKLTQITPKYIKTTTFRWTWDQYA